MTQLRIAAVGAGRMGRGIAIAFAYGGYQVALVDLKPRSVGDWQLLSGDAVQEMRASLTMLADLGAMPADAIERVMARIDVVGHASAALALGNADIVFEGVTETLDAKRDLFARLCPLLRDDAIIASTTSTILVTDLISMVTQSQRLINAHWLNPAYVIPLVELSAHAGTSPAVIATLKAALEDIGKVPVLCGPAPGYIVPRLQALVMNEAARIVEEGIATAEEVDKATRYGMGLRFAALGVVEFIDFGGNDILYYASKYLAQEVNAARYETPAIIEQMMKDGRNGLKSGEGFYDYRQRDTQAYRRDVLARTLAMLRHSGLQRAPR